MLGIKPKLLIAFHPQIDRQMDKINHKLKQYLKIYINHKQENQLKQLITVESVFNNKIYTATKLLSFKVNYRRELRIGFEIRNKGNNIKIEKFVKEMKKRHKKTKIALKQSQEEMKRYVSRNRKKIVKYKVKDRLSLSMKDFV